MEEAFNRLAYITLTCGLLNLDAKLDQAVGLVLNKELASPRFRALVSDPLDLPSECFSGQGEL